MRFRWLAVGGRPACARASAREGCSPDYTPHRAVMPGRRRRTQAFWLRRVAPGVESIRLNHASLLINRRFVSEDLAYEFYPPRW